VAGRLDPAVADVRRAVRNGLADVGPGSSLLVACSGGADSLALASATAFESRHFAWSLGAVVIDHGLQPESKEVAEGVVVQLQRFGYESARCIRVEVPSAGTGLEAAARKARYDALSAAAAATDSLVLLGHTRDDQAETVLLGLARGSGLRSIAGMAPVSGRFRRPLLDLTRQQTQRTCQVLGLTVWEDPFNVDVRFSRVRVRRTVLPVLERELGPGVSAALARTARLAREDADALDVLAERLYASVSTGEGALTVKALAEATSAVRRRVVRSAAVHAGCPASELFAVHIEAVDRLVVDWHGQRGVDLPGPVRAVRRGELLRFEKSTSR
jgi:tRNA(Ile)-lysidine synthase